MLILHNKKTFLTGFFISVKKCLFTVNIAEGDFLGPFLVLYSSFINTAVTSHLFSGFVAMQVDNVNNFLPYPMPIPSRLCEAISLEFGLPGPEPSAHSHVYLHVHVRMEAILYDRIY